MLFESVGAVSEVASTDTGKHYMTAASHPIGFDPNTLQQYAEGVFTSMFDTEIESKLAMRLDAYQAAGRIPTPLPLGKALEAPNDTVTSVAPSTISDQRVLTLAESARLFLQSLQEFFVVSSACACASLRAVHAASFRNSFRMKLPAHVLDC
jgi:hypothetical protein